MLEYTISRLHKHLNILHVVQYDFETFKGGIQRYVNELSQIQVSKGHNVVIYTCSKQPIIERVNDNLTIKRFNYFEIFRTPISISMILSLLKEKYDIIHIHVQFPLVAELIAFIATLRHIPFIITYHNEVELTNMSFTARLAYKIWYNTLLRMMLYLSKIIIVTTEEFALTSPILNRYKDKIQIIPCGIFLNSKKGANNYIDYKKKIMNNSYLLYVGRIKPEKGIHILVEALSIAKESNLNINLVIIGEATRHDELVYKHKLEKLIANLGLTYNVIFRSNVSDEELDAYYRNAIALVLPSISRLEGFGIVQLEAMKHGIPIIVSDIPGPRSVSEGVSITVKPGSEYDLYQAILKTLDESFRESVRELSLKKIQTYDWYNIADKIESLYNIIIDKKGEK